jgi:Zn-finger nucleic acid-binding protein
MQKSCPKDGGLLSETNVNGVLVDTCESCEGVWFDKDELGKTLAHGENIISTHLDESWEADFNDKAEKRGDRNCPVCGEDLSVYNYAYSSTVEIDGCSNHHGVWVDDGEIQKVLDHFVESNRELSAEEKQKIQQLLMAEKLRVDQWEVLQSIYNVFHKIDEDIL